MLTPEVYSPVQRRQMDLGDYVDVARRHRPWVLGPLFASAVIACVVAFVIPNTYVSSAMLRISAAQMSQTVMPTVLSQEIADRINSMEQDILSRASLAELVQRPALDLYKSERARQPLDDVIERMRTKDIKIQLASVYGEKPTQKTDGAMFAISFAYPERNKAKAVVEALVARFMDSDTSGQKTSIEMTTNFLQAQVSQARAELDRLNGELTDFRKQNLGRLPEELNLNAQALTSLESQRASINGALDRDAEEKISYLNQVDQYTSMEKTFGLLATQSADDPTGQGRSERVRDLAHSISEVEMKLSALHQQYTEQHPDVIAAEATLADLRHQLKEAQADEDKQAAAKQQQPAKHQNPIVATQLNEYRLKGENARSALKALEVDREAKLKQLDQVNGEIAQIQGRLQQGPANEQKYVQLLSDQKQANQHYQDLVARESLAEQNKEAQNRRAGETLEVVDPPSLPTSPSAPNRLLIVGIGLGIGAALGVALAGFREIKDTSLKNLKDVRAYTQLPILCSIPFLENDLLMQRRKRVTIVSWTAAVLVGAIAVGASVVYHVVVLKS
jgi:succinoglycan biosynthesis transport protein ExoP